jgi:hypothetical protein
MLTKEEVMVTCPSEIVLEVPIPDDISCHDLESVSDYIYKTYRMDIDFEENSDYFEHIFYNSDLRSYMGLVLDWCPLTLVLHPKYYASNLDDPDNLWTKRWRLLIKNSIILEGVL